jgi:hypothetical protein
MIPRSELRLAAGRFIEQGVRRHVAFVVLDELLQEWTDPEVTVTLTIRREDYMDDACSFTASGDIVAAHA